MGHYQTACVKCWLVDFELLGGSTVDSAPTANVANQEWRHGVLAMLSSEEASQLLLAVSPAYASTVGHLEHSRSAYA